MQNFSLKIFLQTFSFQCVYGTHHSRISMQKNFITSRYSQVFTGIYRYTQVFTDIHRYLQVSTEYHIYIRSTLPSQFDSQTFPFCQGSVSGSMYGEACQQFNITLIFLWWLEPWWIHLDNTERKKWFQIFATKVTPKVTSPSHLTKEKLYWTSKYRPNYHANRRYSEVFRAKITLLPTVEILDRWNHDMTRLLEV